MGGEKKKEKKGEVVRGDAFRRRGLWMGVDCGGCGQAK